MPFCRAMATEPTLHRIDANILLRAIRIEIHACRSRPPSRSLYPASIQAGRRVRHRYAPHRYSMIRFVSGAFFIHHLSRLRAGDQARRRPKATRNVVAISVASKGTQFWQSINGVHHVKRRQQSLPSRPSGKDPEIRTTAGGMTVASFTVATSDRVKGQDGQWTDKTEWHNLVAFQRTAEIVRDYCKKGKEVFVEGKIQTRSWDDKESGQKKYRTEILVNELSLLGGGAPRAENAAVPPAAIPVRAPHPPPPSPRPQTTTPTRELPTKISPSDGSFVSSRHLEQNP